MIRTSTASSPSGAPALRLLVAPLLFSLLIAAPSACKEGDPEPTEIEAGAADCTRDESEDRASAAILEPGVVATGFVCPVEDEDWYAFTMPSSDRILNVQLQLSAPISAIQPTYAVFPADGQTVVAQPPATQVGAVLDVQHCIAPGDYVAVVRDDGNDAQDFRHTYQLSVSTQPDPDTHEPNETREAPTPFVGPTMTGAIACRGDVDWYAVDVPRDNIVQLKLRSPIARYEPTLQMFNGDDELLVSESNPSGTVSETDIDRFVVVGGGGQYLVRVSDDDEMDADPDVPYELEIQFVPDDDPNEPNNHPDEATPVSASPLDCSSSTDWISMVGTIGSPGDNDWYEVPLANCDKAILEVEMSMNSPVSVAAQRAVNAEVQSAIAIVRGHGDSPCTDDSACTTLNIPCSDNGRACNRFGTTCLPDGLCAGAVVCLPSGTCGGTIAQRRWTCEPSLPECQASSSAPPPPNMVHTAVPIYGENVVYVRASDFQSNGADPDTTYTLRVRVRPEPDPLEPDNVYFDVFPQEPNDARAASGSQNRSIPVLDCASGSCCDNTPSGWREGLIATENDIDWWAYRHPCPGQDCSMRVRYEVDGGPVDFVVTIHRGEPGWFTVFDNEERPNQSSSEGALGGTAASDSCFYAYSQHGGPDDQFFYFISVRDIFGLYPNTTKVDPRTRDWDQSQTYRLCVEKVANSCVAPCMIDPERGCDVP